ncbi:TPM domain-containing protein [Streptomyces sp. NBC_01471]|uniref:TPM domain-containing protein n=1 Tax=Streptomyces sp. NBC_01471 TaxID=2903879 RepID=UPI003246A386
MTPHEPSARPRTAATAAPAAVAALAAALAAVCLVAAPVPVAHAAGPSVLPANGRIADRAIALGDRTEEAAAPAVSDSGSDRTPDMGNGALLVPLGLVVVVGGLAIYAYTVRRRRAEARTTPGSSAQQQGWGGAGTAGVPLSQLDAEAGKLLVGADDAIRTSTEELGFAAARFGDGAAEPFTAALTYARSELTTAFRLRQKLDDSYPEDDPARRQMLEEIIARCTEADRRLDEESESFDRLRDLERNAPEALTTAETAFRAVAGRTGAAESTFAALRQRYADSASAAVAGNIEQTKDRLLFATNSLNQARQAVDGGDNDRAAVHVRAAESAVGQATTLVDAVDRMAREAAEAEVRLSGALTGTDADLAAARTLLDGTAAGTSTADLQGRISRAETVTAGVRREQRAGRYDPVDALRRIEEADASLNKALDGTRRAAELLEPATLTARSTVGAAADYLTTHRGAVGCQARTRLAEAHRHLEQSGALADTDAQRAFSEAQQAGAMAGQAQYLAEQDVRTYENGHGWDPGGAVVGGIILGTVGGPARFGGSGTRGRMSSGH